MSKAAATASALAIVIIVAVIAVFAPLGEVAGQVAIENGSTTPLVAEIRGMADSEPVSELVGIPAGGRVIVGRDSFLPTQIAIMRRDCGTTLATYSLDTGNEGGRIVIAPDLTMTREVGGVPRFGDEPQEVICAHP